jgi:single-strand DNA-binding protein
MLDGRSGGDNAGGGYGGGQSSGGYGGGQSSGGGYAQETPAMPSPSDLDDEIPF